MSKNVMQNCYIRPQNSSKPLKSDPTRMPVMTKGWAVTKSFGLLSKFVAYGDVRVAKKARPFELKASGPKLAFLCNIMLPIWPGGILCEGIFAGAFFYEYRLFLENRLGP